MIANTTPPVSCEIPFPVAPLPVPLRLDEGGAIRVGPTRVLLDLVVHAFEAGDSPEMVVHRYPTLEFADVYAVLAWYLSHQDQVGDYLKRRAAEAETLRRQVETSQRPGPSRQELLTRRAARRSPHADAGQ